MAWTAPRTWVVSEFVTAALMNTHLRDNLLFLKSNPQIALATSTVAVSASGTALTLSNVAVPADVGAVYIESWAISFGITGATANPSTATATLAEATAGTLGNSIWQGSNFGSQASSPFYVRSLDYAWAGSTRTVTLSLAGSNGTPSLNGSAVSPVVLRMMRAY